MPKGLPLSRAGTRRSLPALAVLLVLVCASCVSRQMVPLDLGPGAVELYVNGDHEEEVPTEIELRSDRDHKLYVKRGGFVPELVVLESREVEGRDALVPAQVRVRLRPIAGERELEVEEAGDPGSE